MTLKWALVTALVDFDVHVGQIVKINRHPWKDHIAGMPLISSELTIALIFTRLRNLFPLESTIVQFTCNSNGP